MIISRSRLYEVRSMFSNLYCSGTFFLICASVEIRSRRGVPILVFFRFIRDALNSRNVVQLEFISIQIRVWVGRGTITVDPD